MRTTTNQFTKNILSLSICLLSITFVIQAQHTITLADIVFDEATGTITDYRANYTNIIIPESFNVNGTDVNVAKIGYEAFSWNSLTSIAIPNFVTTIGEAAFLGNSLSSITIPNSVDSIGIAALCFNVLTSISIPSNVTFIGGAAFNANAIVEINGQPSNGIVYARNLDGTDDYTTIVSYCGTANNIDFIPDNVTIIGDWAFCFNDLTSVTIPNTITEIGVFAFNDNALSTIIIPSSVTTIGALAFGDNNLSSINIPTSIISIGLAAFNTNAIIELNGEPSNGIIYGRNQDGSDDSTTIVSYGGVADIIDFIPNGVTTIGDESFRDNSITSVTLPNTVSSIGFWAFCNNLSLSSITLPDPVLLEGYTFTEWRNSAGDVVTELIDLTGIGCYYYSCTAQFFLSGFWVSGELAIDNVEGVILSITGDLDETLQVNADSTFSILLNSGRNITITPFKEGYTFSPSTISISNIGADAVEQDFESNSNTDIYITTFSKLKAYPNPVSDILTLEFIEEYDHLEIIDLTGKVLETIDYMGVSKATIDMSERTGGVYILKMSGVSETAYIMFLKQ